MSTTKIVYTHPENGLVCIVTPAIDDIEHVLKNDIHPAAKDVELIEASDLPPIEYHGAWVKKPGKIEVDMDKARAIHMNTIRAARNKKLKGSDEHYTRFHDMGDEKQLADIKAQRQKLRDLPQKIDLSNANSPAELLQCWPSELV